MRWRLGLSQTPLGIYAYSSPHTYYLEAEGRSTPPLKPHLSVVAPPYNKIMATPMLKTEVNLLKF